VTDSFVWRARRRRPRQPRPGPCRRVVAIILEHAIDLSPTDSPLRVASRGEGPALKLEISLRGPKLAGTVLVEMFEPLGPGLRGEETVQLSRRFSLYLARSS
jgi:hypothetical protein